MYRWLVGKDSATLSYWMDIELFKKYYLSNKLGNKQQFEESIEFVEGNDV